MDRAINRDRQVAERTMQNLILKELKTNVCLGTRARARVKRIPAPGHSRRDVATCGVERGNEARQRSRGVPNNGKAKCKMQRGTNPCDRMRFHPIPREFINAHQWLKLAASARGSSIRVSRRAIASHPCDQTREKDNEPRYLASQR